MVGVAVVAWLIVRKRRKRVGAYAFQRMTFIDAEGVDEQDSDEEVAESENLSEMGEETKKTPQ